jgi:hypothetical protein
MREIRRTVSVAKKAVGRSDWRLVSLIAPLHGRSVKLMGKERVLADTLPTNKHPPDAHPRRSQDVPGARMHAT